MVFVDGIGYPALEGDCGKLRGAWEGHFYVARAVRFQERQLVASEWPNLAQFLCDDSGNAAYGSRSFIASVPVSGHGVAKIEAFDGIREVTHEVSTAQFAIRKNLEAQIFLFGEHPQDVLILEGAKFLCAAGVASGREQVGWSEKTAYLVSAKGVRHDGLDLSPKLDPASGSMTVPKLAGPRLSVLESLAAKSKSKGIFLARSGPTNLSVGPAMPRAAMTRPPL